MEALLGAEFSLLEERFSVQQVKNSGLEQCHKPQSSPDSRPVKWVWQYLRPGCGPMTDWERLPMNSLTVCWAFSLSCPPALRSELRSCSLLPPREFRPLYPLPPGPRPNLVRMASGLRDRDQDDDDDDPRPAAAPPAVIALGLARLGAVQTGETVLHLRGFLDSAVDIVYRVHSIVCSLCSVFTVVYCVN